jgi:mono/diheme cytochrome c family protein
MNPIRIVAAGTLLALAGCLVRPYEHDPLPINARYTMKYKQDCASWLRSPRTGYLYCASPPVDVVVGDVVVPRLKSRQSGPTDEASLMAHGEHVYGMVCATCHQANGLGVAGSYPPLAGSGEYYGDAKNHAKIIVHGLSGAITVQGTEWNLTMPPQGGLLTDYDIAAVATFERLSWGNNDGVVMPEDVAAVR